MKWRNDLKHHIEHRREEMTLLLQRLVQCRTVQGNENEAQTIVAEQLHKMGLIVDEWEPDYDELATHPYFVASRSSYKGSKNVVGTLKGKGKGRSIVLNGHIDVVPEGDVTQWSTNPYSGEIQDGKMYGRGTTDMKGGNIALVAAIQAIQDCNIPLLGDIHFHSVIEEEAGGVGTLAAALRGYVGDGAIIPEPTNMKLFLNQQGSAWFRVTVLGKSAHGGTRYEGVSAIEKAVQVVSYIGELEKIRNEKVTDPLYEQTPIPFPINIGKISGGDWPSSVADRVIIEGRMGVAPHEEIEHAKQEMAAWLQAYGERDEWILEHPLQLEWFGAQWLPNQLERSHPLVQTFQQSYEGVLQRPLRIEASPWGTDGGILAKVGHTPTIVVGPGETKVAHYPNEFIELERIFELTHVIAETIVQWCGTEGEGDRHE